MNRLTRKTTVKDFESVEENWHLLPDENTPDKFIKKYPFTTKERNEFNYYGNLINKLGKFEYLMSKYKIETFKDLEEKLKK